jgi:hypothetical protein
MVGFKQGSLVVISEAERLADKRKRWLCQCECGNTTVLPTYQLTGSKPTLTCGRCEWHIKHKDAYISWAAMLQRCDDKSRPDYKYYGGRGITYQKSWGKFINFYRDMGDPPKDNLTGERLSLDRIDVNANYCKENCKWSTRSEQQLNKTTS